LETTRPIFTTFSGVVDNRYVGVDVQSGIDFPTGQGTLPWQPIIVGAKSAEIGDTPFCLGLAFHKGSQDGKVDGRLGL